MPARLNNLKKVLIESLLVHFIQNFIDVNDETVVVSLEEFNLLKVIVVMLFDLTTFMGKDGHFDVLD